MNSTPILTPFINLFHSRRFIVALCTLVGGLLVIAVPALLPVRDVILVLVTTLGLAVIGGYSVSDASAVARDTAALPPADPSVILKDLLGQLIDAGLLPQQNQLATIQALEGHEIKLDHYVDPNGNLISVPAGSKLTAIQKSPSGFHTLQDLDYQKATTSDQPTQ